MKRHMLTHTSDVKDRLYPCPICGVELASKSDVRSHVARDHDQKKTNGDKQQDENLSDCSPLVPAPGGEEQSSDNPPFACQLCNKVYVSKGNLSDHMRRAHISAAGVTKEHQCETCGKTFCQV